MVTCCRSVVPIAAGKVCQTSWSDRTSTTLPADRRPTARLLSQIVRSIVASVATRGNAPRLLLCMYSSNASVITVLVLSHKMENNCIWIFSVIGRLADCYFSPQSKQTVTIWHLSICAPSARRAALVQCISTMLSRGYLQIHKTYAIIDM